MSKSIFFTGQPVFTQLLSLINRNDVSSIARKGKHDRYTKHFDTYTHLVTMLYCCLNKCSSTREVVSGMKACMGKLQHTGVGKAPGKSTLCDANKRRSAEVFGTIYQQLLDCYRHILPDSRSKGSERLFIADSSTITLFSEILKASGIPGANGRVKGGIKVHTLLDSERDVAQQLDLTAASENDMTFLQQVHLQAGSFLVFDKGYVDYSQYSRMSGEGVFFVTRQRKGASYTIEDTLPVSQEQQSEGVRSDQHIVLGTRTHKDKIRLKTRLICFWDREKQRTFEFLTNNFSLPASSIAALYKKRWQIEVLFKRIKQNFPLKYFLGDNENAIKIQIWCAFISELLLKIIQEQLKRKWAFSNLCSLIRLHLMSYIHLTCFLNNPDKLPSIQHTNHIQLQLEGSLFNFKT